MFRPRRGKTNSMSEYKGSSRREPRVSRRSFGTGWWGIRLGGTGVTGEDVMVHITMNASVSLTALEWK